MESWKTNLKAYTSDYKHPGEEEKCLRERLLKHKEEKREI